MSDSAAKPRTGSVVSLAAPLLVGLLVPMGVWWLCQRPTPSVPPSEPAAIAQPEPTRPAPLSRRQQLERLIATDPVGFLDECLARYDREVRSYSVTLTRQERVGGADGKLGEFQTIQAACAERPFRVFLRWTANSPGAERVLFHEGRNNGQLLLRPSTPGLSLLTLRFAPDAPRVMAGTRYPVTRFGIRAGLQNARDTWAAAAERGQLHIAYLGVESGPHTDGRDCFVLVRDGYERPEADGVTWLSLHIDVERLLLMRSELRGPSNQRIALYLFSGLRLNPPELSEPTAFEPKQLGF